MAKTQLYRKIVMTKIATSQRGVDRIEDVQQRNFRAAKDFLLSEFSSHPVTQELKDGYKNPDALLDYTNSLGRGNLYSFMGLDRRRGETTEQVYNEIQKNFTLVYTARSVVGSNDRPQIVVRHSMLMDNKQLRNLTTLVWEAGTSWLFDLGKRGISGFSHYLSKRFNSPPSYSGGGLQTKQEVTVPSDNIKIPYFENLLARFYDFYRKSSQRQ